MTTVISLGDANAMVRALLLDPLLKDSPTAGNMPDEALVAREAELGMWIVWAAARDLTYWNRAVAIMANGINLASTNNQYLDDARQFQPLLDRLKDLGHDALMAGSISVRLIDRTPRPPERLIDIPSLARAGNKVHILSGADVFLRRVSEVVRSPQKVLPELAQKPPVYKED